MDDIDRDQDFEQAMLDALVKARAVAANVPMPTSWGPMQQGGEDCLNCGRTIDDGRRAAVPGCCLCVTCQDRLEGLRH